MAETSIKVTCHTCGESYEGPRNDLGATIAHAFLAQHPAPHEVTWEGLR